MPRPIPHRRTAHTVKRKREPAKRSASSVDSKPCVSIGLAVIAWPPLRPETPEALEALARECQRIARRLKRQRPPGKPASQVVSRALELRSQAVPWHRLYRMIPGYGSMGNEARRLARERLRDAVRHRRQSRPKEHSEVTPGVEIT